MHGSEIMFIAVLIPLGFFAMVFGIIYMYKRENLAMLEKGINPKLKENRPTPYRNLKWGLLLVGSGMGLFLAYILDNFVLYRVGRHGDFDNDNSNVAVYFALIAIGGGLGLISSYRIEKKELLDKKSLD